MEGNTDNKKTFNDLVNENKGPTFEEESDTFAGEDITVIIY